MLYRSAKFERHLIDKRGIFGWLKVTFVKRCKEEEKREGNGAIFRNTYIMNYWANFLQICMLGHVYEGHKYVNLIEIGAAVIEIQGVENG